MKKIHWPGPDSNIALCGQIGAFVAASTHEVTCRGCREKLGKQISRALRGIERK